VAGIISALIFSLCHYIGQYGDAFELGSFLYRATAGIVLGAIYVTRGFGVAAGTHAVYDIFVVSIMQMGR
jgi:membrane protease YdiL (CAAX protease family)